MAWTNLTDDTWASVTLSQDEIWQCLGQGSILVSKEPGSVDRGIELQPGMVREFAAGDTVHYRPVIIPGVERHVVLARDPK